MIDLELPFFNRIYGIDITPAMMSQVDQSSGKVQLIEANTEAVPLKDETANMITSNSFLHHLWDIKPTIYEAFRLLKPGGVFFSEEDPNILFWQALKKLDREKIKDPTLNILRSEMDSVTETHKALGEKIDIDPETVKLAEYQKMVRGGMNADEIRNIFQQTGFSEFNVEYYWFLAQGKVAKRSPMEAEQVEAYLKAIMPLSNHLFKYLRVVAWK
jgi:ubiquinone/menaquinone biosynthesis C-methylase UbiE